MPRTKRLVSALALALAGASTAQAQEFSAVISFGDSLSDAGQYSVLISPAYGSFTTNPDDVWAQVLASSFGLTQTASLAGGTNYAYGGAPTGGGAGGFTVPGIPLPVNCFPITLPCQSVSKQITTHLTGNGGHAVDGALYTYWAGANDLFDYLTYASPSANPAPPPATLPPVITGAQAQLFMGASALNSVGQLAALQNAGADYIVVLNLPDIGRTPAFIGNPGAGSVSGLVFVYNSTLNAGLAGLADGIIPINAYGLINEVLDNPGAFGFDNVTGTACGTLTGSVLCTPPGSLPPTPFHWLPGTNETYLFADGVHPTGGAHAMLARVVVATIQAPGQVSMAGELPLQVYNNHANVINNQIFGMSRIGRDKGESNVYANIQYGHRDFDTTANTSAFDSNVATLTVGADVRYTDYISLGGTISFGNTQGDSAGHSVDALDVLASAYGVANWKHAYVNVIATGGGSHFEIDRRIDFNATDRVEHGETSAQHWAFELGGGLSFGGDDFRHGPYVSLTNERVRVKGYAEDALDSTAMWFSDFTRHSTVGRIGYQAQGHFGSLQPYGRIAYARENDHNPVLVQAGSNTMNGHFTFPGYAMGKNWYEADLGLEWSLNDSTELSFAWRGRINDSDEGDGDGEDVNVLSFGARWEFGAAVAAPEPEVVAEEPVATCADMDDDGDSVNNCDDKCPGSTAGEAMGPDGCAVPATEPEPEPEMEAKPFRN